MTRIFDLIEMPGMGANELVRRFPEHTLCDLRFGSQVIVRSGQAVVLIHDGRTLDAFGPGRHTITTANTPSLANLIGKAFGSRTPFAAEVYFVNTRTFHDVQWTTLKPILVGNLDSGVVPLYASVA